MVSVEFVFIKEEHIRNGLQPVTELYCDSYYFTDIDKRSILASPGLTPPLEAPYDIYA